MQRLIVALAMFYLVLEAMQELFLKLFALIIKQFIEFLKDPHHLTVFLAVCIVMIIAHEIDQNGKH